MLGKEQLIVKTEVSGGQRPKYQHHNISGRIQGVVPFNHHQFILLEWYLDLEQIQRYIPMDNMKGKYQHNYYQRNDD